MLASDVLRTAQCMSGAPHMFLARPVQSAELVKCVRAILRKELGSFVWR